jgi:hypothetical protein
MGRWTSERALRGALLSSLLALSDCTLPGDSCFLVHNKFYFAPGCLTVEATIVDPPEGPLPPDTRSYVVRVDLGDAALRRGGQPYATAKVGTSVSRPPTAGPPTSDDGGRTWSFEISGLERGGNYVVEVWGPEADAFCSEAPGPSATLELKVAP